MCTVVVMATPQHDHADREQLADVLRDALDAYFQEVGPQDTDTDDLAWTLVTALKRAGR
jgi:hypothetical protein